MEQSRNRNWSERTRMMSDDATNRKKKRKEKRKINDQSLICKIQTATEGEKNQIKYYIFISDSRKKKRDNANNGQLFRINRFKIKKDRNTALLTSSKSTASWQDSAITVAWGAACNDRR
jgi:hypothetical protein